MKFLSKENDEVCDLEIHGAEDGGIDVVRREIVFEKHYKHYNDIYEDFDDYLPEGKNYDPSKDFRPEHLKRMGVSISKLR